MINTLNECLALEKELTLDENFRNHEEWDSMCNLILMTCLDEHYSIKITSEKLKEFSSINEIFEYYIKK